MAKKTDGRRAQTFGRRSAPPAVASVVRPGKMAKAARRPGANTRQFLQAGVTAFLPAVGRASRFVAAAAAIALVSIPASQLIPDMHSPAPPDVAVGVSVPTVAVTSNSLAAVQPPASVAKALSVATVPAPQAKEPTTPPNHTAIYDIEAHTVYLPDGRALEAHSGRGKGFDDIRFTDKRRLGPTPPNAYDLALRKHRFHGVQAIRLVPAGGGQMFGRNGILAHTYMRGPDGESAGCVVFKDYQEFLQAYLKGDIDRLVVVPHIDIKPALTDPTVSMNESDDAEMRTAFNSP